MKKIFAALLEELSQNRSAVLCGIVASHGSTPRGAGAKMLVLENGGTTGTIGGGAVEFHAEQFARTLLREKRSAFETYRLSAGEIAGIGMICGGDVRVYFQFFAPSDRKTIETILPLLDRAEASWLVTSISENHWSMGTFDRKKGLQGIEIPLEQLMPALSSRAVLVDGDPALFLEPLTRPGTVYLFGAGHVARELVHILSMADFRVSVWDQRTGAALETNFPDAAAFHCGPFQDAFHHLPPVTAEDYIVIMTPGHQADYEVLAQALRTPAKYIGCIGSRKKVAATREKLLADGFSNKEIDRVHAPIGLPIGGETPAEVAISVAAQLIACRSGKLEAAKRISYDSGCRGIIGTEEDHAAN